MKSNGDRQLEVLEKSALSLCDIIESPKKGKEARILMKKALFVIPVVLAAVLLFPQAALAQGSTPPNPWNLASSFQKIVEDAIAGIPNLIAAVVIFIVSLYAAALLRRVTRKALQERGSNPQAILLVSSLSYWAVLLLGLIVALEQVGFNLTAFLAGLGIAGFTIGFALKDFSKNFISGLLMLIQQPFGIGDAVEIGGISGIVLKVDLRSTEIRAFDGRLILIPNADVYTQPITNYSRTDWRRVEIKIGVAYDTDMESARRAALQAIQKIHGLIVDRTPTVYFQEYGASTMNLALYYYVNTNQTDPFVAKDTGLLAIMDAFKREGIEMPYPTQVVYTQSLADEKAGG
jgi:small conductance mechanosensitive channel